MTDETEKESTFLVTHVEPDSAVLRDVHDGQIHTLDSNPGLAVDEAVEATVAPEPPLNVTYRAVEVAERWSLSIEESEEPPTVHERELAADLSVGELAREPRAGIGEIHVLTPPEARTEEAVSDVIEDRETTLARAARLGVNRVEIRSEPGLISVRYLP
ncbi:DUF5812 family protein [Halorubrum vacuolatum]|uniref:Uncharacterized protein n=1 Tax=Halorubrum vacuolatum TaxID=63740 RepID=A0A238VSS9_HALVU|nr:DUF5812 family protein [Halorubrum vacuolatum]SNR37400.1 hypothetical protein SAMN06264855_10434 [Halorubrum vacuolatum]